MATSKKRIAVREKGRITLGEYAIGVDSFEVTQDSSTGVLTLVPFTSIPTQEVWIHKNKKTQKAIQKGLKESREGLARESKDINRWLDEDD